MHLSEHPLLFYLAHIPDTIPDGSLTFYKLLLILFHLKFILFLFSYIFALSLY